MSLSLMVNGGSNQMILDSSGFIAMAPESAGLGPAWAEVDWIGTFRNAVR